jgi:hypothetical protein
VGTGNGDPKVPELPSVRGYSWATLTPGGINTRPGLTGWGLGVRLTTSHFKKIFVKSLQGGKP